MTAHREKNLISLGIIAAALSILYVCFKYQDQILESGNINFFVTTITLAMALMLVLLYIVSQRVDRHTAKAKKSSSKKRK